MKNHRAIIFELNYRKDEKVKISPVGDVKGFDGRVFKIDGKKVIEKTKSAGIDIVLEENHYDGSASGWFDINSLENREDGIYASLNLTPLGEKQVNERLYRYLSPVYVLDRNSSEREVLLIDSVGLVNKPNLLNKSLNKKEDSMDNKAVELENKKLKEENKRIAKEMKNNKIETAIKNGELLPNKREFAQKLDDELLEDFLALNKKDLEYLKKRQSKMKIIEVVYLK